MPWFIWMAFLTVPAMVGVATTIAANTAHESRSIAVVVLAAGVWLFVAVQLKRRLQEGRPKDWIRRWVVFTVIAPLGMCFVLSLRHDATVLKIMESRVVASKSAEGSYSAAAAPTRRVPSWRESRQLVARMRPLACDFLGQLLSSIPLAWWFIAFGISLQKGKQ